MRFIISLFLVTCGQCLFSQAVPDLNFEYKIHQKAFNGSKHPKVMIDGAHSNYHQMNGGYAPLAKLLSANGFELIAGESSFSAESLSGVDVLVISNAIHPDNAGRWVKPIFSAFTKAEIKTLNSWVKNGGSLLLIADHMPFAGAASDLARSFGVSYLDGFVGINQSQNPPNVFRKQDKSFSDSDSYLDRKRFFPVDSVATFTGSAFKLPSGANSWLNFSEKDTVFYCDTAWSFSPGGKKESLRGYSQGGFFAYGKGMVSVFGEAAMFTAQHRQGEPRSESGDVPFGFNAPEAPDNVRFALNVFYSLLDDPTAFDERFDENLDRQQILEQYFKMDRAFDENRMTDIASVYLNNASVVGNGFEIKGKVGIELYWNDLKDRKISWDQDIENLEVSGNLAIQTGTSKLVFTVVGDTLTFDTRYTIVWKQDSLGLWKIGRDQHTPLEKSKTEKKIPATYFTGIGGIFFKAKEPAKLRSWYADNFGLLVNDYGALFEFYEGQDPEKTAYLQWSPFSQKTTYFKPSEKEFMINYRVRNLEILVEELKKKGILALDKVETYDYGKFVHYVDPENNKIELWEPVDNIFTRLYEGTTNY